MRNKNWKTWGRKKKNYSNSYKRVKVIKALKTISKSIYYFPKKINILILFNKIDIKMIWYPLIAIVSLNWPEYQMRYSNGNKIWNSLFYPRVF